MTLPEAIAAIPEEDLPEMWMFGTTNTVPGHHMWNPAPVPQKEWHPKGWWKHPVLGPLDGVFLKRYPQPYQEFEAVYLDYRKGNHLLTVMQWPDFTGDKRVGSNTTIVAEGNWIAEELMELAKRRFPWAKDRFNVKAIVKVDVVE